METLTNLFSDPQVQTALLLVGGLLAGYLLRNPQTRAVAEGFADYLEALKYFMNQAELTGKPGAEKLLMVLNLMSDWLKAHGIVGEAHDVTMERVRQDLEILRAQMFPADGQPSFWTRIKSIFGL